MPQAPVDTSSDTSGALSQGQTQFLDQAAETVAGQALGVEQINVEVQLPEFPDYSELIRKSFESLEAALITASTVSVVEGIIIALAGALAATIAAFVFNLIHWKYTANIATKASIAKVLLSQLESLEKCATEYWLQPYKASEEPNLQCLEVSIKSLHESIRTTVSLYISKLSAAQKLDQMEILNEFLSKSYTNVTGGNFQSKIRAISRPRATKNAMLCNKIKPYIASVAYG